MKYKKEKDFLQSLCREYIEYLIEFIQLDSFRGLCDNYVDTVIATSKEYSEKVAQAVDENTSLKARIAELERKLNGKPNTSGT